MKLTVQKALDLHAALLALDGYQMVVANSIARVGFKFSGVTRKAIGRNIARLKTEIALHNEVVSKLFQQHADGRGVLDPNDKDDAIKLASFNVENEKLLKETIDIELVSVATDDLLADENPIPGSVLASLEPILSDE